MCLTPKPIRSPNGATGSELAPVANDRERLVGISTPIVAVDTHTVRVLLMGLDGEAALAVIEAERKAHRGEDGYVMLCFPAKATRVLPG